MDKIFQQQLEIENELLHNFALQLIELYEKNKHNISQTHQKKKKKLNFQ